MTVTLNGETDTSAVAAWSIANNIGYAMSAVMAGPKPERFIYRFNDAGAKMAFALRWM